ncbi:hypothetical protein VNI00_006913 [Paramarasmius palmivorus]|uniref:Uncharacterized protein n=1 Tax=Paramarasmius palmivorus TaxID=297713 RepID=A0AAW0D9U6_9AGAR
MCSFKNYSDMPGDQPFGFSKSFSDATQLPASPIRPPVRPRISASPVFMPVSSDGQRPPTDLILLTADFMIFYVDEGTLCRSSGNNFGGLLPVQTGTNPRRVVYLSSLLSSEVHVMLQVIYDLPFDLQNPHSVWQGLSGIRHVVRGIDLLPRYGVDLKVCAHSGSNIFKCLLTYAALYPLDIYALAAQKGLHDLAVAASSHLLSINLDTMDPAIAARIGPEYLKMLLGMLENRKSLLGKLLATEPGLHNPTKNCGFSGQGMLKAEWSRAVSSLTWNMHAGITTSQIKETFLNATAKITCRECLKARDERLRAICSEWQLAPAVTEDSRLLDYYPFRKSQPPPWW